MNGTRVTSILKWAGGKRRIAHFLSRFSPEIIDQYFEPFLGSGALFLYLAQTKPRFRAVLSDSNNDLINVYKCVRDNVYDLIEALETHQYNYYGSPEEYYYYMRDVYRPANDIENACRLLFLNKTCYNGLYRVNRSGSFNVPHGTYKNPVICNRKKLQFFSEILRRTDADIICSYYQHVTLGCRSGDFIYLDPPYFPMSKTSYFKDYTKDEFGCQEQTMLAKEFRRLNSIRCTVLLSNSNSPFIRDLYRGFNIITLSTIRPINCNASNRLRHQELLITNKKYQVKLEAEKPPSAREKSWKQQ
ncbi:MAG TPA: Dam family site-specific DNA-(adenine-N6)-methyltransferase [Nitrososphaeraceae archaeon]|nr:Dam family site-specific DNA-(adenine-N6)-methyltransferase [Nitrososphaeraceae archaeon]